MIKKKVFLNKKNKKYICIIKIIILLLLKKKENMVKKFDKFNFEKEIYIDRFLEKNKKDY
jgi:hypothetical protein